MDNFIRTKLEENQFTSLVNAISSGGGGGSVLSQVYRDVQLGIGLNGNAWETLFSNTITIPNDGYYFVNSSFQKINGLGDGLLSIRILCDNVELLNDETENGTRSSVSFNSTLNIGVKSNNIVHLTQGRHTFTVQAYSNVGTTPIGFCTFEVYK